MHPKKESKLKLFCILVLITTGFGCSKSVEDQKVSKSWDLKIYSYDSLVTWGLGSKAIPIFEEMFNCVVSLESVGDTGNLLTRVIMEKKRPQADIVIGIDNTFLHHALEANIFLPYKAENLKYVDQKFHFDNTYHLTPFDYGYLAFVYDSHKISEPPTTFGQMQDGIWRNNYILIDPRTSSPGKAFLLWTIAAFGENGFGHFWRSIKNNIMTIPASWDEAYNMFLAGEAPIVLSYSTSPLYHIIVEDEDRYKHFIPQEGGFKQIEGAGIVAGTQNLELAQNFIEFMLSVEFQELIPTTQWMFPVNKHAELPQEFQDHDLSSRDYSTVLNLRTINNNLQRWYERWQEIMIE